MQLPLLDFRSQEKTTPRNRKMLNSSIITKRTTIKYEITVNQFQILMAKAKKFNLSFDRVFSYYQDLIVHLLYNKNIQVFVMDGNKCTAVVNIDVDSFDMNLIYIDQIDNLAVAIFKDEKFDGEHDVLSYTYAINGKESEEFATSEDCYESLKMAVSKMIEDDKILGVKEYKGYQFSVLALKTIGSDFQDNVYVYSILGLDTKDAWKSGHKTAKEAYDAAIKVIEALEPIDEDDASETISDNLEEWTIEGKTHKYDENGEYFVEDEDEDEDEDGDEWSSENLEF